MGTPTPNGLEPRAEERLRTSGPEKAQLAVDYSAALSLRRIADALERIADNSERTVAQ